MKISSELIVRVFRVKLIMIVTRFMIRSDIIMRVPCLINYESTTSSVQVQINSEFTSGYD